MSKKVRTAVVQFIQQSKSAVEVVIDRPSEGDPKQWHYLGTQGVPVTGPEGVDRVALVSMYQMRVPPPQEIVPTDDEVEEDDNED